MTRDYYFEGDCCVVIIKGCNSADAAWEKLSEIVQNVDNFHLNTAQGDEE